MIQFIKFDELNNYDWIIGDYMLRGLYLHGFGQSETIGHHKCSFLRQKFKNKIDLTFINGSVLLNQNDTNINKYGWWVTNESNHYSIQWDSDQKYLHLDQSLHIIEQCFQTQGPFDFIIGFSQGASLIPIILEKLQPNLKFVILVSGFKPLDIQSTFNLPSLHCIGEHDEVIKSNQSLQLADLFNDKIIYRHEGKHVIPSKGDFKKLLNTFLDSFI